MFRLIDDLDASLRSIGRRPLEAVMAVGILGLGLAAALTTLTYINAFSRPFPGVDTDGLVQVFGVQDDFAFGGISYPDYLDIVADLPEVFSGLVASQPRFLGSVRHGATSDPIAGQGVTGGYFDVLGVEIRTGRSFDRQDDRPGAEPVMIISHRFWRDRFGSAPDVVGQVVYLNGNPRTIVGVAPPDFLGTLSQVQPDIWLPLEQLLVVYGDIAPVVKSRDQPYMLIHGRLREGFRMAQAEAALTASVAGLDELHPRPDRPRRIHVAAATWVEPGSRLAEMPTARLMLGGAVLLLLLACANAANLLLARATGRRREFALRSALGAGPGRLAGIMLAENILLALVSGALAGLIAVPASARLGGYFAQISPWLTIPARRLTVDWRIVVAAVLLAVLTGALSAVPSVVRSVRSNLAEVLRSGNRSVTEGPRRWLGVRLPGTVETLVGFQVSVSVLLLLVASLVLMTLNGARGLQPGFRTDGLVSTLVSISSKPLEQPQRRQFYRELLDRLDNEPWMRSASLSEYAPTGFHRRARVRAGDGDGPATVMYVSAAPRYFETLGLEVLSGRAIDDRDREESPLVAVVNEAFAERFLPGDDPIGRVIRRGDSGGGGEQAYEIIGVVPSTRSVHVLVPPEPMVYFAYRQHRMSPGNTLLMRTAIESGAALPQIEDRLRGFDPDLVVYSNMPYEEVIASMLQGQRLNAELFSALAFIALGLAAAGIFGMLDLALRRRVREIGVRRALGAGAADIVRAVAGRLTVVVVAGVLLGSAGALAAGRVVSSLLLDTRPTAPVAWLSTLVVLCLVLVLAGLLPARRAIGLDPADTLRVE